MWILGALAIQNGSYRIRTEVQRSAILQRLNTVLPPSGPLLNSLRRLDPFPRIDGPDAGVAPPRGRIARDPEVQEAAASVVKVLGSACGLGVAGSGWVAAPGLVVTNAHVVAGEEDTTVLLGGREPGRPAQAVHFDPRNDIAILRVPGLDADPLPIAGEAASGDLGGDPRLPAQRAVRRPAGARRDDPPRDVLRRLRPRPGRPLDDRAARPGAAGELGRADGRRRGPGGHDGVRGDHERAARRLRRAERDRQARAAGHGEPRSRPGPARGS